MSGFLWAALGLFVVSGVFVMLSVMIGLRIGIFGGKDD